MAREREDRFVEDEPETFLTVRLPAEKLEELTEEQLEERAAEVFDNEE